MSKTITELMLEVHDMAVSKGFYENSYFKDDPIWLAARLMHMVSELSEGLEAVRDGNLYDLTPKSGSLAEELADCCIRIFDTAASLSIDLEKAIEIKMIYNATRPIKHGRKAL